MTLKNEMLYEPLWIDLMINDFINEISSIIQNVGYMSPVEYRHNPGLTL